MGLEAATRIHELVATNPVGATDPRSQGDDHIRMIKASIQGTFPNFTGQITATHVQVNYSADLTGTTGTGNMVRSASPTLTGTAIVGTINAAAGSVGVPSLSFATDTDTGIYSGGANNLNFATGGARILNMDLNGVYFNNGTVSLPSIAFFNDTNTGLYVAGADTLFIATGGAEAVAVDTVAVYIRANHIVLNQDGTASVPAYSFANDQDTGIYRGGTNNLRFSTAGAVALEIDAAQEMYPKGRQYNIAGLAASPSYSFASDPNTGIYSAAADHIGVATGGSVRFSITDAVASADVPVRVPDGAVGAPTLSFNDDTDTGLYLDGANSMTLVAGGQDIINVSTAAVAITKQLELTANSASSVTAGAASALPATPQGYIAVTINGTQRRIPYYPD